MISETASFAISLLLIVLNVYAAFAGLFPNTFFLQMVAIILLSAVSDLLLIPFS